MAVPMPPGALVRHYVGSDDKRPFQVDLYYSFDTAPPADEVFMTAQLLAEAANTGALAAWQGWLAGECFYFGATSLVHINGEGGHILAASGKATNADGAVGSLSGDTLPDYVASVISRYTTTPGPKGRGRIFVPCVAEINTNTSSLNAGGQAALLALAEALFASITTTPEFGTEVVWTPAHWPRTAGTFKEVQVFETHDILNRQSRRRLRPLA